ncbi:MAG: SDR family NAD(P)-dependent oxidoreductase [Kofleriaceae bacterium]
MSPLKGKRALVTGASSGIGAAIARQLAAKGVDLVLVARRDDALGAVAASCTGVSVETVPYDLGTPGAATAVWTRANANGPIDICINNAGFGYHRRFEDVEMARDTEMIQLNVTTLVELSKLFIQSRAGKTERGYLMNVGSIAAYQSTPNFAVYAATKAFVRNFTEALAYEHAGTPLSITCLTPGSTATEFHALAGAGTYSLIARKSMMAAEKCARIGLAAMERGKRNIITGWINKVSCFGVRLVPRRFAAWVSTRVVGSPPRAQLPERAVKKGAA